MNEKKAVSRYEIARASTAGRAPETDSHVPAAATAMVLCGRDQSRGRWTTSAASYTDYPTRDKSVQPGQRAEYRVAKMETIAVLPLYLAIPCSLALELFTWRPSPHPIRSRHVFTVLSSSATASFLSPQSIPRLISHPQNARTYSRWHGIHDRRSVQTSPFQALSINLQCRYPALLRRSTSRHPLIRCLRKLTKIRFNVLSVADPCSLESGFSHRQIRRPHARCAQRNNRQN